MSEAVLSDEYQRCGDVFSAWLALVWRRLSLGEIGVMCDGVAADGRQQLRVFASSRYPSVDAEWPRLLLALLAGPDTRDATHGAALASRLGQLLARMPAPGLISLHAALEAAAVSMTWLGGDRTEIGHGRKCRVLRGPLPSALGAADRAHREAWATSFVRDRLPVSSLSIPIYSVTGSIGKTTTVRLLCQLLEPSVQSLGYTASDGIWVDGERKVDGDCIGGRSAQALATRFDIDAAVLEVGRGGLVKQGFPFHSTDVGSAPE